MIRLKIRDQQTTASLGLRTWQQLQRRVSRFYQVKAKSRRAFAKNHVDELMSYLMWILLAFLGVSDHQNIRENYHIA